MNTENESNKTDHLLTQHDEEGTTTVQIDESNSIINVNNVHENVPENNECSDEDQNKEAVILHLDIELEDVMKKANELEQKCTVFQLVETERKSPSIWVQYNQNYRQIFGKQIPHQQMDGGFGAPLAYDPESRNYFVKFVFILVFIMLSITATYGVIVLTSPTLKEFYQDGAFFLMILSAVVLLGMNYVMACSACSRVPPCNFISLFIVVVAMSNLVAAVTVRYKTNILVLAVIATVITVGACVLLACSSFDFTAWYIYVIVIAMVFMAVSMIASITMLAMGMRFKPLQIVLLFIGTLIQVVILIMELQMILGGRTIEIGEDDYALAAYMLYTSIIDIFLKIVEMMGAMEH